MGDNTANIPELYRLVRHGRWSSTDWQGVRDRLAYLSTLYFLQSRKNDATRQTSQSGSSSWIRTGSSEKEVSVRHQPQNNEPRQRALSELCYFDTQSGKTALHLMCYWRPAPDIVGRFLVLTPELVWERTCSGETALHMACSNSTRLASVETIEMILNAAEKSMSPTSHRGSTRREYALLTDERGRTALHCAAQADAPLLVLQALLHAAPEAANMVDAAGKTPLDMLTKSYDIFISQYLDCVEEKDVVDEVDEMMMASVGEETALLPWISNASTASKPPLRHYWEKAALFTRASAATLRRRGNSTPLVVTQEQEGTMPMLHATLAMSTSTSAKCPPLLLRLVLHRCIHQAKETDAYGNYPLHYAAQASAGKTIDPKIIQTLLREHGAAARARNVDNLLPVQLLRPLLVLRDGGNPILDMRVEEVVRDLVRTYPPALFCLCNACPDAIFPHILAMLGKQKDTIDAGVPRLDLSNTFELLAFKPELLRSNGHAEDESET